MQNRHIWKTVVIVGGLSNPMCIPLFLHRPQNMLRETLKLLQPDRINIGPGGRFYNTPHPQRWVDTLYLQSNWQSTSLNFAFSSECLKFSNDLILSLGKECLVESRFACIFSVLFISAYCEGVVWSPGNTFMFLILRWQRKIIISLIKRVKKAGNKPHFNFS